MAANEAVPVMMSVARGDGAAETVRVGFAVRKADGFELHLGQMFIAADEPIAVAAVSAVAEIPRAPIGTHALNAPTVSRPTPPTPIPVPVRSSSGGVGADASFDDLEYLAERARRVLADPRKSKWHDDERILLRAIEAEMERKRVG